MVDFTPQTPVSFGVPILIPMEAYTPGSWSEMAMLCQQSAVCRSFELHNPQQSRIRAVEKASNRTGENDKSAQAETAERRLV